MCKYLGYGHPVPELKNLGTPDVYSLKTLPSAAESHGKLWLPGLRADLPSTRTLRTHMQVYSLSTESSCSLFVLGCHLSGVV